MQPFPPAQPHPESQYFALYIHWPYCLQRCPYCDFNAHLAKKPSDAETVASALIAELVNLPRQPFLGNYFRGKKISSIFFGGGTPSLMLPSIVEKILQTAQNTYGFSQDIEITLEANPGTLEGGDILRDFKAAGVNRLSMGVQSLNDVLLKKLGRIHDAKQALHIIKTLPTIFERWSFDLIYSQPSQTMDAWLDELKKALSFGPQHMSLYQLTIEPGTDYYRQQQEKKLIMLPDDAAADMFLATRETMAQHGLPAYEVSNFAAPTQESRHNLNYWQYGDWLGIGAGAEGRITTQQPSQHSQRWAIKNFRLPDKWATAVHEKNSGIESNNIIPAKEIMTEKIMMGLRLTKGAVLQTHELPTNFMTNWQDLVDEGLAYAADDAVDGFHYRLTEQGFLKLNSVIDYLV